MGRDQVFASNSTRASDFEFNAEVTAKQRNGYSEEEILKKREALENVLMPYRVDENAELFRRNGFASSRPSSSGTTSPGSCV